MSTSDPPLGHVFITGGCGLLGYHIVSILLSQGHPPSEITVFDISTKHNRHPNVTYITGDIGLKTDVSAALAACKPNIIINSASPDGTGKASKSALTRCNVTGVQNVISCAQDQGIKILVHTSSSDVAQDSYHDIRNLREGPVLENPVDGSTYAKSKALGEVIVLNANRERGLLTCALRPTSLIGENDVLLQRHFLELGRSGNVKFQIGSRENLYDFVYAGNVAEAHVLAAVALLKTSLRMTDPIPENEKVDGEAFFISNGDPWPFWGAVRFVCRTGGYEIDEKDVWKIPIGVVTFFMTIWEFLYWVCSFGGKPAATLEMMKYTAQFRYFDITKAKERLGYRPRVSVEEGFRRGVKWYQAWEKEQKKTI